MPAPRQEVFRGNRKSCPSPAIQPNALVDVNVKDYENSCYKGSPKQQYKNEIHVKKIKTIYKKQCQVPPTKQWENNFAVSPPESTLAVPNLNQPPIQPIFRERQACAYPPAEDPPRKTHENKSCRYDPDPPQMQGGKQEKVIQQQTRKEKSCRYTGKF